MSWYTLDDTAEPRLFDVQVLDRARPAEADPVHQRRPARSGPDLHLWASPWVAPSWMDGQQFEHEERRADATGLRPLSRQVRAGVRGRSASRLARSTRRTSPGYARVHWTQSLLVNFFKTYMGPTFSQQNVTAEIWCAMMLRGPLDANIASGGGWAIRCRWRTSRATGCSGTCRRTVAATLAPKGAAMQTEHECGNYNFDTPYWKQSQYNASKPPNDHAYGEESWQLIRDWTVRRRELLQRLEHGAGHHRQEPGRLAPGRAAGRGPQRPRR